MESSLSVSLDTLVTAARAGDARAAEQLYSEARPLLLRWALALGVDPDAAADLVQETLWAAHRGLRRFDPSRGALHGWLATILVRRLHNRRRARARRLRLLDAFRRESRVAEPTTEAAIEARLTLARLLESLTERQREVVALYEIAELDAAQTARILGLTAAGVRSIARDARRRLKEVSR